MLLERGGLAGQDGFGGRLRGSNILAEEVSSTSGSDFVVAAGLSGGDAKGSQRWRVPGVSMFTVDLWIAEKPGAVNSQRKRRGLCLW